MQACMRSSSSSPMHVSGDVRCARPRERATVISNPAAARPAGGFRVGPCHADSRNTHPRLHDGTHTEPRTEQLSSRVQATHGQHKGPGPFQCRRRFPGFGRRLLQRRTRTRGLLRRQVPAVLRGGCSDDERAACRVVPRCFKPTDLTIMRMQHQLHFENVACDVMCEVVISGALFLFLLRKHFITEFFFKKKSGDVNDEAILAFYILLHKRAKHILPPYLSPPRANSNLNSPQSMGQDLSKKNHYNTQRCNYKTNSSESIKRHQYADV